MDREHVKGSAEKAKGAIKEGAGKLSGNKDIENEGKVDEPCKMVQRPLRVQTVHRLDLKERTEFGLQIGH